MIIFHQGRPGMRRIRKTAVAGYISVVDLTKASDIIRSRTYEAFFPLLVTSLFYLLLCTLLVALLRALEKKVHPEHRSVRKDIAEAVKAFRPEEAGFLGMQAGTERGETQEPLIRIEHLRKSYGDVTPVRDVSCDIFSGDVIAVIGPALSAVLLKNTARYHVDDTPGFLGGKP